MKFFVKNNQLDEMQEKKLLVIESRGFWGVWAALFIALMVQQALDAPLQQWIAELVIFMLACAYALIESLRNGLWDRHFVPTLGGNILASVLGGLFIVVYSAIRFARNFGDAPLWTLLVTCLIAGLFTAALIFVLCQISLSLYNKRRKQLETDADTEEGK